MPPTDLNEYRERRHNHSSTAGLPPMQADAPADSRSATRHPVPPPPRPGDQLYIRVPARSLFEEPSGSQADTRDPYIDRLLARAANRDPHEPDPPGGVADAAGEGA